MPELPEVETTRRGILPYSEGKVLDHIVIRNGNLRWPVSTELASWRPHRLQRLVRRGKYLIMEFEHGSIMIHLGMSGSLRVLTAADTIQKHDHVDLHFGEWILRFNDPRRFGSVLWTENWETHALIAHLGPEPLSDGFSAEYLYARSKGRKMPVKQFIMDSQIVVGVGNIYANEALFLSGIHPSRKAGRVSRDRYELLANNIKQVLTSAIDQGGTTLRDFVGGDGKPGYFQQKLYVYGRSGKACKKCGSELKEKRQNGRSTVFCGVCQS